MVWLATAAASWGQSVPAAEAPLRWVQRGQSGQSAATAAVPSDLRAVSGTTLPAAGPALRWRTPAAAHARLSSYEPAPSPGSDDLARSALNRPVANVRLVGGSEPVIPYEEADPRTSPFTAATPEGPAPRELPRVANPRPLAAATDTDDDAAPLPVQLSTWQDDTWQDDLMPEPSDDAGILPAPDERTLDQPSGSAAEPCDRIYNERDCCADEARCNTAREFVERDALSKISLDITPLLRPDVTDPYNEEAERNADLARAPVRTWHDRAGNVLAVGRMNHIERRQVLVLTADNQIQRIGLGDLCDDDLCFLSAWWRVPTECTLGDELYEGRAWQPITLTWKASGVCHKPLYFEDAQLERYGHTMGHFKQPVVSGAHFFASLITLPYQAGINPPWECRYPLGYYRPGSCAPWLVPPVPLSVRGALWEAGAVVGGVFLIP